MTWCESCPAPRCWWESRRSRRRPTAAADRTRSSRWIGWWRRATRWRCWDTAAGKFGNSDSVDFTDAEVFTFTDGLVSRLDTFHVWLGEVPEP